MVWGRAQRLRGGKEANVAVFVLLSTLTAHGRETLHANPERIDAVNAEVESFGCQVMAQYALLGPWDFLTLIEAPDNETVAHLSIDLGSRGTVTIQTLPAMSLDQLEAKLKGRQQLAAEPVSPGTHNATSDLAARV
jgi:uncharacterized protein with GYD domain